MDLFNTAQQRANARFDIGEKAEATLLQTIANMTIRDRLVPPRSMKFAIEFEEKPAPKGADAEVVPIGINLVYSGDVNMYRIHRHALGQLAGKVEFPITYLNKLNTQDLWRLELLIHNLNTLFHNSSFERGNSEPRFLHRLVGGEVRAFLSRRFNRHLASLPMLRAFIEAVRAVHGRPIEALSTDIRWSLKCFLPLVFEAFPGQYICVGVTMANSDFGAGKMSVTQTVWDPMRDARTVLDESFSRVHLGSVIEDSDMEMSEETAVAEVEAQASAIRDAVTQMLSEESVGRALKAIKAAHEQEIPWHQLKGMLSRILYDKEVAAIETLLNSPGIVDLPPVGKTATGEPLPTKWWAASVISRIATNENDERKMELQQQAGKILGSGRES